MPNDHPTKHPRSLTSSPEPTLPDFGLAPSPKRWRPRTQSPSPPPPEKPKLPRLNMTQWKTHSSYLKHTKAKFEYDGDYQTADYEQLELIGDGLIRFVVMDKMMELYPRLTPGGATALLSKLQSEEMLASISVYYNLPDQLRADPSILRGLQANPRVQCDLFEALVGALYHQEGFRTARKWVRDVFHKVIIDKYDQIKATFATTKLAVDPFVKLHEYCQAKRITPDYDFHVEGRSPDQTFTCTMTVRHLSVAGRGRNKQQAKNAAAALIWDAIPPSWSAPLEKPTLPVAAVEAAPLDRDLPPHLQAGTAAEGR